MITSICFEFHLRNEHTCIEKNRNQIWLTPFAWRYSTVLATICSTALASLSEKNRCLKILSNNSPPCISSVTMYTLLPLSNTWEERNSSMLKNSEGKHPD